MVKYIKMCREEFVISCGSAIKDTILLVSRSMRGSGESYARKYMTATS